MKTSDKPFWQWVEKRCPIVGLTEARLANKLDVTPQTFASWKARNQFRTDLLERLGEALGEVVSVSRAVKTLKVQLIAAREKVGGVQRPKIEEALSKSDAAYRRMEKTYERYASYTLPLIQSLGKDCFFSFSGCTTSPYEFEGIRSGNPLALELAKALFRGAMLLYIRPTKEGVDYYEEEWGYGRIVRHEDAINEIRFFREFVEELLVSGKAFPQRRMESLEAQAWLHERLSQCYILRSPMWMPGIGLGMVGWAHARDLKARMTISLPGGKFGGVLMYPSYNTFEFRFGRVLRRVVATARSEIEAMRQGGMNPKEARVHLSHLKGKDDAMFEHTAKFYDAFDRLLRTVTSHEAPADALDRIVGAGKHEKS